MSAIQALAPHHTYLDQAEQLIHTKLQETLAQFPAYVEALKTIANLEKNEPILTQTEIDRHVKVFAEAVKTQSAAHRIFSLIQRSFNASEAVTRKPSFRVDQWHLVDYWEDCEKVYGEEEMSQAKEALDKRREELGSQVKIADESLTDFQEKINNAQTALIALVYRVKTQGFNRWQKLSHALTPETWHLEQEMKKYNLVRPMQGD